MERNGAVSSSHSTAGGWLSVARSHGSDAGSSGAGAIWTVAASSARTAAADQQSTAMHGQMQSQIQHLVTQLEEATAARRSSPPKLSRAML
jgi:hypothetical protein